MSPDAADFIWSDPERRRSTWNPQLVEGGAAGAILAFGTHRLGDDGSELRLAAFGAAGWQVETPQATMTGAAGSDELVTVEGPTPGLLVGAGDASVLVDSGGSILFFPVDTTGTTDVGAWAWRWDGTIPQGSLGAAVGWVGDPVGDGRSYLAALSGVDAGCDLGCSESAVLLPLDEPGLGVAAAPVRIDPVLWPQPEPYAAGAFAGADLNGDGVGDLVLGNRSGDSGAESSGWIAVFDGPVPTGTWSASDSSRRWHRTEYYAMLGDRVLNAGDVTGDGLDDLLATSWDWGGDHPHLHGLPKHAYLIPGDAESGDVEAAAVAKVVEPIAYENRDLALDISVPGDVDGDSVPDILIGDENLSGLDVWDVDGGGTVWLLPGTTRGSTVLTWNADCTVLAGSDGELLHDVTGGNIDGDAFADVVLGATGDAEDGADSSIYTFLSPI